MDGEHIRNEAITNAARRIECTSWGDNAGPPDDRQPIERTPYVRPQGEEFIIIPPKQLEPFSETAPNNKPHIPIQRAGIDGQDSHFDPLLLLLYEPFITSALFFLVPRLAGEGMLGPRRARVSLA
jgi:hypothetical protein